VGPNLDEIRRLLNEGRIGETCEIRVHDCLVVGIVKESVGIGPEVFELLLPVSTVLHQVPDTRVILRINDALDELVFRNVPFVITLRGTWAKPQMIWQQDEWESF
jgi:hypothetical protein